MTVLLHGMLNVNDIYLFIHHTDFILVKLWRYERSSRLIRNLSNCEREAWKKFRLQRDSNPWPLRYRCSALPTELWSHNCWEQVNFSGFIAQLVEHCTGIAEVTGSNPAEAWIFFRLLFRNCLNCVSTAKIFHNVITHNRGTNPVTIMLYYP